MIRIQANIEEISPEDFTIKIGDNTYRISNLFRGKIVLQGDIIQFFKNNRSLTVSEFAKSIKDKNKLYELAELYTEGVTNKDRLLSQLKDPTIRSRFNIGNDTLKLLTSFVKQADANPPALREQLTVRGFKDIAYGIHFEDPMPELIRSCDILWVFIENLSLRK